MIFILSDSVGETAELVVRAAVSQFDTALPVKIRRIPFVSEESHVEEVLAEAEGINCIIVYTFVIPHLRRAVVEGAERHCLPAVDVMGPVLRALERIMPGPPRLEAGLMHRLDEDYYERIEAIEFAVRYDDGQDLRGLAWADVVLIGVSRTSKTPLSLFLANQKIKAANVPLVSGVSLPDEVLSLPADKIIGLTISPHKLAEVRQERLKTMGLEPDASYASFDLIEKETAFADQLMVDLGCPVLDVTNMAVEEIATKIGQLINKGDH